MKHIRRDLNSNRMIYRKYAKNYRHNMNILTFLKSNYKYKRRTIRCHISSRQQRHQWSLPCRQHKQEQKHKHKLPANEEMLTNNKQIIKRNPFYENIKLDKFLRIFILIMQQATPTYNNKSNSYNNKTKNNNSKMITQLVAKMKTIKNTNKTPPNVNVNGDVEIDVEMKDGDEADINKNHYAYKDANKDTDINVDISNIPDEISHQQNNYDKVSTITSTPIKCQRRKHHQIKATKSSPSSSSTSSQISAKTTSIANVATTTTITTSTMDTLLSSPSIANYETCQWSTILRHYVSENSSLHQHQYHHNNKHIHTPHKHHYQHALHIQSLITSRVLNINSNNKCNKQTINCSRRGSTNTTQTAMNRETGMNNIYQSFDQYVNSAWNRSYTLSCLLLTLFIAFSIGVRSTTAGACWQTVLDNGKCNEIFSLNISKSECCGANQEFAYTEREPTNVEYFFATAIGGGMECSPCLESCRNVKCGPNKKCVKRKGRPKCICAPECGAARRKRKQREHSPMQQEQKSQQQHHTLHLVDSHIKNSNNDEEDDEDGHGGDGYFLDVATNIRSTNAFKIKIEKSQQQSRDTRSLSSEITNINLGLENGKDTLMKISSGEISPMERHHYKENNQNQRKTKHLHMHQWQFMQQQQQQEEQQQQEPNHKNQEPKGSRRILITANVEHTEKPTTRRLQILSNVRTTNSRRHNSNKHNNNNNKNIKQNKSNKKEHGQHEDTDPLDYDDDDDDNDEDDYNYNENTEADTKEPRKKNISSNNNNNNNKHKNKNNRNDDSTRFLNQSLSRHKLKTNTKSNTNNRNRNTNKNQHDLHRTKLQQNSSNNNTRVRHSQQNGRHAENTPHHRHHNRNHHSHHQHRQQQLQLQQQQYEQHEQNQHNHNHQQQSQNHGRHKHKNGNKQLHNQQQHNNKQQQTIVLKIPKNNKDYNITTTNNIAIVNATATNSDKDAIATDVSSSTNLLQQSKFSKAATAINSLNLSIPSATPQHIQSQLLLLSSSSSPSSSSSSSSSAMSSLSSTTPVNSTMSADYDDDNDDGAGGNAAAASDDHYHSRIPNHGNKLATSSILSDTWSSPSSSSPSHSQFSVASASASTRSSSESSVVQMSAKGEGVSLLDDHKHRIEIPTKIVFNKNNNNNNNNNDNIISTLHSNLHNTQQQQQRDQQIQSQHNYQTPLFDGFSEQFDLIGFQNKKQQQQAITNGDSIRPLNPVCGTDGRTYNTECQLRKRACRTDNPNLQISYRGHCRTTCNGVQCLNGLTCVEDQNSMPHCIACKIECPQDDYDNDVVDATKAVCGADGKTYKNTCDINRMICKIGRSIGVAYPGPCREDQVTCDDINCGPKQVCLIDLLTHKPRCTSCRYKCSRKRRPSSLHFEEGKICGVNNHTYNSWCEMRKDSCSTGFYIDVKYSGACH